ncbi:MAG TPA: DUF4349 domain-containing protein [Micromonosporaceae bacterium]
MNTAPRLRRGAAGLLAAGLVGVLALAGCGASDKSTSAGAPGPAVDEQADRGGVVAPPGAEPPKDGGAQQAPVKVEPQRSLIYTGTMSVKVDDVVVAADRAIDIATGAGGLVGSDSRTIDGDRAHARLVLRVPADKFSAVLNDLAKVGDEQSRAIETEDVTDSLIDLDARVATQEASVARVRQLLARAQSTGEIMAIESELTRRMADLDSLKQRREKLAGLVALSTITLSLYGPAAEVPSEPETGFVAGLKNGWAGFLESVAVLLTVAGYLLPWAIAIGVPIWLIVWVVRRRHARRQQLAPAVPVAAAAMTPPPNNPA